MHDRRLAARAGELKPSAVRELLKHSKLPGVISLGGGIPAPELFDTEGLELAVQKVMSERFNDAFQYGLTEGYPPLRQAVSEICHSRGVACSAARSISPPARSNRWISLPVRCSIRAILSSLSVPPIWRRCRYFSWRRPIFSALTPTMTGCWWSSWPTCWRPPASKLFTGANVRQSRWQNAERGASSPVG